MKISDLYEKIRNFTVLATELDAGNVYFANQNSPKKIKPFITINLLNFKNVGFILNKDLDNTGIKKTVLQKVCTASFQAYSDKIFQAEDLLNDLYIKLYSRDIDVNIAKWRTLKAVSSIPTNIDASRENRAILDVEIAYLQETQEDVGIIEEVYINSDINNIENENIYESSL